MGLLTWIVGAPLAAAVVILVTPGRLCGFHRVVAWMAGLLSVVLTMMAWARYAAHPAGFGLVSRFTWFTLPNLWQGQDVAVRLSFGVDGLSLPLLTLGVIVSALAMIAAGTTQNWRKCGKQRFFWFSLTTSAIAGVFTALDVFTFFVALELTLVGAFFLLYLFGADGHRAAAFKFLIYRGAASIFLLTAMVGIVYGLAGGFGPQPALAQSRTELTFDLPALLTAQAAPAWFPEAVRSALFLTLLLGVFIEEALVPLHTWLPTVSERAEKAVNMLIGGVITKTGAYILLRFGVGLLPTEAHRWGTLLAVLGVLNILYGAFAAWAQQGWRRLIAFGSISHMGLFLLGVASASSAGLQGAMFMILSSGLLTALLFFLTGSIEERTQTLRLADLGGLSRSMPLLSGFLLVAALGSLGLPMTSGFVSEIQAFIGGFGAFPRLSFVGVLGIILSAVYLLYAIQQTTFGPAADGFLECTDARAVELVPTLVLTALVLLIGVYPAVVGDLFNPAAQALLRIGG